MIVRWREFAAVLPRLEVVRFYDLASSEPTKRNRDPDWTAGVTLAVDRRAARWLICHASRIRATPAKVVTFMRDRYDVDADLFGRPIPLRIEKEGGSGGAFAEEFFFREFVGADIALRRPRGSKAERFKPFSIAAQNGRVDILTGWDTDEYFDELELFPDGEHDDYADATSGAYRELTMSAANVAPDEVQPDDDVGEAIDLDLDV